MGFHLPKRESQKTRPSRWELFRGGSYAQQGFGDRASKKHHEKSGFGGVTGGKMKKGTTLTEYIALFECDEEAGYGVVFPDLPGCFSAGDDYDDAVRNAHEALALYAEGNDDMPEPRSLEQIRDGWEDWAEWENEYKFIVGKVALYPVKAESQRFNISMPADLVARIDRVASNRSSFIVAAAQSYLEFGAMREKSG